MTLGQLLVLYLMAGSGVGVAVYLRPATSHPVERWVQVFSAVVFWPLFLPLLLTPATEGKEGDDGVAQAMALMPTDELAQAIAQVDAELEGALQSLDGWAEDVLLREKDRLHEVRLAWSAQARRIREMDRLLSLADATPMAVPLGIDSFAERLRNSQRIIGENRERLREVRERSFQDLLGTLAWVRELVSMIHLAKFTGAPASRAEELVAQVAAAVEGLSALTWQEEETVTPLLTKKEAGPCAQTQRHCNG